MSYNRLRGLAERRRGGVTGDRTGDARSSTLSRVGRRAGPCFEERDLGSCDMDGTDARRLPEGARAMLALAERASGVLRARETEEPRVGVESVRPISRECASSRSPLFAFGRPRTVTVFDVSGVLVRDKANLRSVCRLFWNHIVTQRSSLQRNCKQDKGRGLERDCTHMLP